MAIRQRAVHAGDKEERHHAILDTAERLLLRSTGRGPSMAEVADAAGLAKGTIYLYFPSKKALLLALLERNVDGFFLAVAGTLEGSAPLGIDQILALVQRKIVEPPLFLPLAGRCFDAVVLHTFFTDETVERCVATIRRAAPTPSRRRAVAWWRALRKATEATIRSARNQRRDR